LLTTNIEHRVSLLLISLLLAHFFHTYSIDISFLHPSDMGRITWHTFVFLVVVLVTWFFVDGKLGSHEATKLVSVELFIHLYTNISNLL